MKKEYYAIQATVLTDVGKVRKNNEDNFCFFGHIVDQMQKKLGISASASSKDPLVFGVFDGMGGHEFGERASLMTAQITRDFSFNEMVLEENLVQICHDANELVCDEMRKVKQRVGTTASFVALYDCNAYICNIGDTPIYLYRDGQLSVLHEEHTEKKMYERIYGKADPNKKYRLTQNIGVFEEEMLIKPYSTSMEVYEGDMLMICSDGLTDMVSEERIAEILSEGDLKDQRIRLRDEALENGGRDNITIILIQILEKKKPGLFPF